MIPHRMLNDDIFENGLRERVTACRKRLRLKRVIHKAHVQAQLEPFPETRVSASEFPDYNRLIRADDYSPAFESGNGAVDSEMLLLVWEQEVGIT